MHTNCPYCGSFASTFWAEENSWHVVKCNDCGFLYLNPRPDDDERVLSTSLGAHVSADHVPLVEHRVASKARGYAQIVEKLFPEICSRSNIISWTDIGSGYGEFLDAVSGLVSPESFILGLEPMKPKADVANSLGYKTLNSFITSDVTSSQFVSSINVFSHLNNFDVFLQDVSSILDSHGEFLLVTGDMKNVIRRDQFPGPLSLPDHVAFASYSHLIGYLERNGFTVVNSYSWAIDGFRYSAKNLIKYLLGQPVCVSLPYTSGYKSIAIRAKKCS